MADNRRYRIAFLGPEFTFSHEAAEKAIPILKDILEREGVRDLTPSDFELVAKGDNQAIEGVLRADPDAFAVIPISNSERGDVFRFLPFCSYEKLGELRVPLSFCLCSHSALKDIKMLATMTVAYEQVKDVVDSLLPQSVDRLVHVTPDLSTARAAQLARENPSIAAICSEKAASAYGVPIVKSRLEGNKPKETTFYIFRNTLEVQFSPPSGVAPEYNHLLRGAHVYSGRHLNAGRRAFADLLKTKSPLKVKWGIDPIHSSLHLGHLANVLKLRDFIELGHRVTVVMGTFTGVIADPSGNLTQRPPLDSGDLERNAEAMQKQIRTVLGEGRVEFVLNHNLVASFDLRQFLRWLRNTDVRSLLDRPDFQNRLKFAYLLSAAEFIYPLFQAFDTVHVQPDVEVGGVDQVWNCVLGKDIMKQEGFKVPFVLLLDALRGVDGSAKMSSFQGNAIHLSEPRDKILQKILRLPRELLYDYYLLLTRIDIQEISDMRDTLARGEIDETRWKERLANEVLRCIGGN